MLYCFGSVSWNGYLERYIDIFVNNYITIFKKLISLGINYADIPDPRIVYNNETTGEKVENAKKKLATVTGKKLVLVCDKHKYTTDTVMYSTRNRLRSEFRKAFPTEKKVYFYFPIDDNVRPDLVSELLTLGRAKKPMACMFKFYVADGAKQFTAGTRPIRSYEDIHPGDWGGYCAYNILNEYECPLYPHIAIPNVAFYIELYKAGYEQYASEKICVDHLRHSDSHHFKYKDSKMSENVKNYLLDKRAELCEGGHK